LSSESLTVNYSLSGLESFSIILVVQCNILQCLCMSFSSLFFPISIRLGGVHPIWDWHGQIWHLHVSRTVWEQVLHGLCCEKIWGKPLTFPHG